MEYERRYGPDRRAHHASPFSPRRLLGQRRQWRRVEEGWEQPLDWYPPRFLAAVLLILLLCGLDSHNTLLLLEAGAVELNPLMNVIIGHDIQLFVAIKFLLTGLGLIVMVAYQNAPLLGAFKTRHALYGILLGYVVLIAYQSALLAVVPGA